MYAATSIFRTVDGPVPAYTLAPLSMPGEYALRVPLGILTGSDIITVKSVRVHEPSSAIVCVTPHGWLTVAEHAYRPQAVVQTITGFHRVVGAKKPVVSDIAVQANAFLAAVHSSGVALKTLNEMITRLVFYEVITKVVVEPDLRAASRYTLHFDTLTDKQLALWLYTHLTTLHRLGKIIRVKVSEGVRVNVSIKNTHWRDLLTCLMRSYGCRIRVRTNNYSTTVYAQPEEFALLFKTLIDMGIAPSMRDLKMFSGIITRKYCVISSSGEVNIVTSVDMSNEPYIEEVEHTPVPAVLRIVSFPELDEHPDGLFLEHNNLRYVHE